MKLRRIKLINWHLFRNQTIEISGNSLISGENGAGKSTFLDAIQYVLTVGKAKFNTAANNKAKRDLEGYLRCKLGVENKTYLRNGDVTSHVALEFYDEKNNQVVIIGVVVEINKQSRIYEHFYYLKDCEINDDLFINDKVILNYQNFKKQLMKKEIHFSFFDTKEKTRQAFLDCLKIKNSKYIELIPKALAFKPIDELNKFVFEFLLNEKEINLSDLSQNVKSYREFEKLIYVLKEQENNLEEIKNLHKQLENLNSSNEVLKQLSEYCKYQQFIEDKESLEREINKITKLIDDAINEKKTIENKIEANKDIVEKISFNLQKADSYKYYQELDKKIIMYEKEIINKKRIVDDLKTLINNEINLYTFIREVKVDELTNETKVRIFIDEAKQFYSELLEKLLSEVIELKNEFQMINEKLVVINKEIESLNKNKVRFDDSLLILKSAISQEIKENAKALCELIEINDEKWRNAIEGYLNTRRFDIIIESKYFDNAVKVYEKITEKENIHSIGIVNTKELEKYQDSLPNSLARKINTNNKWCRYYVNMLLGQVVCCENVLELKKYHRAITKNCMVYQNYTVRSINQAIYQKPFIGINALRIQLESIVKEKKILEEKRGVIQKLIQEKNFLIEKIKANQLEYIKQNLYLLSELAAYKKELEILKNKKINYNLDQYLQDEEKKLKQVKEEINYLELEKNELLIKIGKLSKELEVNKENYNDFSEKINNFKLDVNLIVIEYYKDLKKKYKTIEKIIKYSQQEIKTVENEIKDVEVKLLTKMNQYNIKYQCHFKVELQNITAYFDELERIRNFELVKYQKDCLEARHNCEVAFKEHFIYQLRENIINAHNDFKQLNQALKRKKFGNDEYEFIIQASIDKEFRNYYDIIMSDSDYKFSLFEEGITEDKQTVLQELFTKLVSGDKDVLATLCDYRNYMSYDIKIINNKNEVTFFSKVSREKSGGETQTPFYVVIAASFEQLIVDKKENRPACLVMFDEAFNNMDEARIKAMMHFYQQLDIQLIISVPPQRIETIFPFVNTTLIVIKDDNESFIETFSYEIKNEI